MPELPEVETTRRGLVELCAGASFLSVELNGVRTVRRGPQAQEVSDRLRGLVIQDIDRLGKYLIFRLRDPDVSSGGETRNLVVHLGMSGRFLRSTEQLSTRHVAACFDLEGSRLAGGESLWFYDPRTFGEIFLSEGTTCCRVPVELSHLGVDLLDDRRSSQFREDRRAALFESASPIKARLLDQRYLCGLGNIYSDEVLFRTQIHPRRPARSLEDSQRKGLLENIEVVMEEAVHYRGSSLLDKSYRDLNGDIGEFQRFHQAYGRSGEPCGRCSTPLIKELVIGRSSTFCPLCQGRW